MYAMSTKYTPGPWVLHIDKHGGNWRYEIRTKLPHNPAGGAGKHIATINSYLEAKGEANAQLIAAAPELLAACAEVLDSIDNENFTLEECASLLKWAIAKAEGRE